MDKPRPTLYILEIREKNTSYNETPHLPKGYIMSDKQKNKVVDVDAEIVEDNTPAIQIDWKALGKKVAVYGGLLTAGILIGMAAGAKSEDDLDADIVDTPAPAEDLETA